jgi:hypothetical protein
MNACEMSVTRKTFRQSSGGKPGCARWECGYREFQRRGGLESYGCFGVLCCEGCVVDRNAQLSQVEQGP